MSLSRCPLCRQQFLKIRPVPSLRDPVEWFEFMDIDRKGLIDRREVISALKATLPVDADYLERSLTQLCEAVHKSSSDELSFKDLMHGDAFLWRFQSAFGLSLDRVRIVERLKLDCSKLHDKREWFTQCDRSGAGSLTKEQIFRALLTSCDCTYNVRPYDRLLRIRWVLEDAWPALQLVDRQCITLIEFCRSGGCGDQLIAGLCMSSFQSLPNSMKPRCFHDTLMSLPKSLNELVIHWQPFRTHAAPAQAASTAPAESAKQLQPSTLDIDLDAVEDGFVTDVPDEAASDAPGLCLRPAKGFATVGALDAVGAAAAGVGNGETAAGVGGAALTAAGGRGERPQSAYEGLPIHDARVQYRCSA
eukprot:TRINITY_DN14871_c0_g4_i2.p1 TRINITY_DN14871_c0_g4~~TRINITY_DN14871_c0_g4_i2.p1  ORF type:complete len:361 (-),score=54.82 TRINITY_DN14871_c0_g4_i2:24-1106(-)